MSLSQPLVPDSCDLTDFAFMPLDVRRLLNSETWILGSDSERSASMCLWLESWHQVPAGSLPNNDKMLAHLSKSGTKWKKVKDHVLRGWIDGGNGRLYHPVVSEKALEAWIEKLAAAISGAAGNEKRWEIKIDVAALKENMVDAIARLKNIAPRSKALNKKIVKIVEAASPPDTHPHSQDVSPPDSGSDRNREGEGEGEGIDIKKESAEEILKLEMLNKYLQRAIVPEITQERLDSLLDGFNANYEDWTLSLNQRYAKMVQWIKNDNTNAQVAEAKLKKATNATGRKSESAKDNSDYTYFGVLKSDVAAQANLGESEYDCAFRLNQEQKKPAEQPPEKPIRKARPAFTSNEDREFKHLVSLNPELTKSVIHERAEREGVPVASVLYSVKKELESAA